jgi:hypothetical protein
MEFLTAQARSVYIPQLGGMLRLGTISVPEALRVAPDADTLAYDKAIARAANFVFGVPPAHIMTFTRATSITETILARLSDPPLQSNLKTSLAGSDTKAQVRFDADLKGSILTLTQSQQRIPDVQAYAACMLRNVVLNRTSIETPRLGQLLGLGGYPMGSSIVQSLYHDLLDYDEISLRHWVTAISAAFDARIPPSAKKCFDDLLSVEIPFAGSDESKKLSLADAIKYSRGCAFEVLEGAAAGAAYFLARGDVLMSLYISGGGIAAAFMFIAFGQMLPHLEGALERGFQHIFDGKS